MSQTHIIQRAWRCFGKECQSIIDILNQDAMTWDIKQLITIYIPRTVGVADEDKPYGTLQNTDEQADARTRQLFYGNEPHGPINDTSLY